MDNRYEEALKRAKAYKGHDVRCALEEVFPELKKSKDERIRKALIEHFRWNAQQILNYLDNKEVLAWLEKQGESKKVPLWKHWKDGIAGNGDGKRIYLVKNGDNYSFSSCLGFECDYIELSELDELLSKKQSEQNYKIIKGKNYFCVKTHNYAGVEWIKGTNYYASDNYTLVNQGCEYYCPEYSKEEHNNLFKEVKCDGCIEKQGEQKPNELSEEDEKMKSLAIECIKSMNPLPTSVYSDCINWLQSLKSQKQWKPSEEQLKSLQGVIDVGYFTNYPNVLETLYKQLKQL